MNKKVETKISGIYRLFIKVNDKEYSYIGISKNTTKRIKQHMGLIRSFYNPALVNFKKFLVPSLEKKVIPTRNAFYWKTSVFLYLNDKTPKDFEYEILERLEADQLKTQYKEMEYIEKYKANTLGFNGVFDKAFQLLGVLNSSKNEADYKQKKVECQKLLDLQREKNNDILEDCLYFWYILNEKMYLEKYMFWTAWILSVTVGFFDSSQKKFFNNIFNDFCEEVKYKINLKNKYSFFVVLSIEKILNLRIEKRNKRKTKN